MVNMKALVKKAKSGDGEAFVQLIKQYENVLYRVASKYLNHDEDVADAMQETIMTAFEKLPTLKKPEYFNTWICKILINNCNSLLKKNNRTVQLVDMERIREKDNPALLKMELEEELSSLNADYRTAIELYYIVGMNIKEIGELLKEPEGTIKSRLSRAKAILRINHDKQKGVIGYEQRV